MKTTHLCVGGPLAGKRHTILYGRAFVIPILPRRDLVDWMAQRSSEPTVFVEYHEQYFCHVSGRVVFWAPVGQTPTESLRLLLETYEAHHAQTPSTQAQTSP